MAFGFGGVAGKGIPTRMVVMALGAVILLIGGVYSAMTFMVSQSFQEAGRSSEAMISSLRAHMTADMLHDGLRGVVFRAMYSGITYDADAVAEAKSEIVVISPYFVPGQPMMKVFADLRARGVKIRVLTNSLASNDAPAAHAGYARYRVALLNMGVELYEMRSESSGESNALGSSGGSSGSSGSVSGSRASLHAKAVVLDGRLIVIGSMNLDLRSQLQNTEVALLIRSSVLSREAVRQVESTLRTDAYRLELSDGKLTWRAPPGAAFADATTEPDTSVKLRLLIQLIGPLAPDEML